MSIEEAIAHFEQAAKEVAPELLAAANPPISDETLTEVKDLVAPLRIPDSLVAVARWHDGGFSITTEHDKWIPLGESLRTRSQLIAEFTEIYSDRLEDDPPNMPIPAQWFFFCGTAQDIRFAEMLETDASDSHVWTFASGAGPSADSGPSSVESLLRVAAASLERGVDAYMIEEEIDPDFGQHDFVELFPEHWPDRWDQYHAHTITREGF